MDFAIYFFCIHWINDAVFSSFSLCGVFHWLIFCMLRLFSYCCVQSTVYGFSMQDFVSYVICKYVLSVYGLSFHPIKIFHRAQVFNLMKSSFSIFFFYGLCFSVSYLRSFHLTLAYKDFLLFYKSVMVLYFPLRSMIQLELIFV